MAQTNTDRMPLRRGGWIEIDERSVFVDRPESNELLKIDSADIRKINLEVMDWGLTVFSAAAVVFGIYFAFTVHRLGGLVVALIGLWSILRSYRKRYTLVLWVDGSSEPVAVQPSAPEKAHAAIARLIRPEEPPVTEQ